MSDVIKDRRDIDGNPVTLDKLCRLEPAWAASRIRVMEAELARLRAVRQPPGCDCPFEAGQHKLSCSSSGRMVVVSGAICWFLRWVLDEDERRALRRQAVFMLPTNEDDESLVDGLLARRREEQRDRQRHLTAPAQPTLRDRFAMAAMADLASCDNSVEKRATEAYEVADAMLRAREEGK